MNITVREYFLVGNNDAHGKNFSLLYGRGTLLTEQHKRISPLYDVLCTTYYPDLDKKMAMKIGGEYSCEKILPKHFMKMAEESGLAKPFVKRRVPELAEMILSKLPEVVTSHPISRGVASYIENHCKRTIKDFKEFT